MTNKVFKFKKLQRLVVNDIQSSQFLYKQKLRKIKINNSNFVKNIHSANLKKKTK